MKRLSATKIQRMVHYPSAPQPNQFYLVEDPLDRPKLYATDSLGDMHLLNELSRRETLGVSGYDHVRYLSEWGCNFPDALEQAITDIAGEDVILVINIPYQCTFEHALLTEGTLEVSPTVLYGIEAYYGEVAGVRKLAAGSGYSAGAGVATTGGSGTGLTVEILSVDGGAIEAVVFDDPGTGYLVGDVVTIAGGTGGTAIVTAVSGDDFSNVGAEGPFFFATGVDPEVTPTDWSRGTVLRKYFYIPKNICVLFDKAGSITVNGGGGICIGHMLDPGDRQVFFSDGNGKAITTAFSEVKLPWWTGPETSGDDDRHAMRQAVHCTELDGVLGGTIKVPIGDWHISGIRVPSNVTIEGAGHGIELGSNNSRREGTTFVMHPDDWCIFRTHSSFGDEYPRNTRFANFGCKVNRGTMYNAIYSGGRAGSLSLLNIRDGSQYINVIEFCSFALKDAEEALTGATTYLVQIGMGSGYSTGTGVATTSAGSGTGLTVNITKVDASGRILEWEINNGGTSYAHSELITVSGGGGNATFRIGTIDTPTPTADQVYIWINGDEDASIIGWESIGNCVRNCYFIAPEEGEAIRVQTENSSFHSESNTIVTSRMATGHRFVRPGWTTVVNPDTRGWAGSVYTASPSYERTITSVTLTAPDIWDNDEVQCIVTIDAGGEFSRNDLGKRVLIPTLSAGFAGAHINKILSSTQALLSWHPTAFDYENYVEVEAHIYSYDDQVLIGGTAFKVEGNTTGVVVLGGADEGLANSFEIGVGQYSGTITFRDYTLQGKGKITSSANITFDRCRMYSLMLEDRAGAGPDVMVTSYFNAVQASAVTPGMRLAMAEKWGYRKPPPDLLATRELWDSDIYEQIVSFPDPEFPTFGFLHQTTTHSSFNIRDTRYSAPLSKAMLSIGHGVLNTLPDDEDQILLELGLQDPTGPEFDLLYKYWLQHHTYDGGLELHGNQDGFKKFRSYVPIYAEADIVVEDSSLYFNGDSTIEADSATVASGDYVYFGDISDGGNLKKATAESLGALGVTNGDKGDILVSDEGATWTLESGYLPTSTDSRFRIGTSEFQGIGSTSSLISDNMYWDGGNFRHRITGPVAGIHFDAGVVRIMSYASGLANDPHAYAPGDQPLSIGPTSATFTVDVTVPTEAYGIGWSTSAEVPTKGALYTKIESITGLSEGDKGDIIVSAGGGTWTIDSDVVTYAKMQNTSAASKLLGRGSAGGAGDIEEITLGTNLSMSGTTLNATGGVTDGDKGDISVLSGVWTIDDDAVTYAKIQDVTATDRLLGRSTAGAGIIEEITCTAAGRAILDDVSASDQRTTLGLGTIATQNSNAVSITGGTISLPGDTATHLSTGGLELEGISATSNLIGSNMYWNGGNFKRRTADTISGIHFDGSTIRLMSYASGTTGEDIAYSPTTQPFYISYSGAVFTVATTVPTDAYGAGWSGSAQVPTKGDLYTKIQSIVGVTEGDKGDISVTAGGAAWNIDTGAVTYAKIQNVSATDRLLGRSTAGAGVIEEITCTAAGRALLDDASASDQRTTLGLGTLATQNGTFSGTSSGTNTGDQTITLTGDVTGSGTGSFAATIANDAVTYAKIQDVSATDRLLGRSTAGAGIIEEITCTAAGRALLDDASASDQRTTLGLGTMATQNANAVAITGGTVLLSYGTNDSNIRSGTLELQGTAAGSDLLMSNIYWDGGNFIRRTADYGSVLHMVDGQFLFSMIPTGSAGALFPTAYPGTQLFSMGSSGNTSHVSLTVPTEAYNATSWDGSSRVPTQDAVRDKIESLGIFSTIAVSGQSNVVADSNADTLTFAEGSGITITTNNSTDTVTVTANVTQGKVSAAIRQIRMI